MLRMERWLLWLKEGLSWPRDHLSSLIAPPCWLMEQLILKSDDRGELNLDLPFLFLSLYFSFSHAWPHFQLPTSVFQMDKAWRGRFLPCGVHIWCGLWRAQTVLWLVPVPCFCSSRQEDGRKPGKILLLFCGHVQAGVSDAGQIWNG